MRERERESVRECERERVCVWGGGGGDNMMHVRWHVKHVNSVIIIIFIARDLCLLECSHNTHYTYPPTLG